MDGAGARHSRAPDQATPLINAALADQLAIAELLVSKGADVMARTLERKGRARIALVGAGAGGVELLLSVERRLRREVARAGFDPAGLSFVLGSTEEEARRRNDELN